MLEYFLTTMAIFVVAMQPIQVQGQADASAFGKKCTNTTDCTGGGLICNIPDSACTYGECRCPDGQSFDALDTTCKPSAAIGTRCAGKTCKMPNSACNGITCECSAGYNRTFSPAKIMHVCVATTATVPYAGDCLEDTDCAPPFQCSSFTKTCDCEIGFAYTGNAKRYCAPMGVGDPCKAEDECLLSNSYCTDGICACSGGYKTTDFLYNFLDPVSRTYTTWVIQGCIAPEEPTFTTGEACLTNLKRGTSKACDGQNLCVPCNRNVDTTGICVSMPRSTGNVVSPKREIILSSLGNSAKFSILRLVGMLIVFFVVNKCALQIA